MKKFFILILTLFIIVITACKNTDEPKPVVHTEVTAEDIQNFIPGDKLKDIIACIGNPIKIDDAGDMGIYVTHFYNWENGGQIGLVYNNGFLNTIYLYQNGTASFIPQEVVSGYNDKDNASTLSPENTIFRAFRKDENSVYLLCLVRQKMNLPSSMEDSIEVEVVSGDPDVLQNAIYYVRFKNNGMVTREYKFKYDEKTEKFYEVDGRI